VMKELANSRHCFNLTILNNEPNPTTTMKWKITTTCRELIGMLEWLI